MCKLMDNAVYSKTMEQNNEDLKNRIDVRLVGNEKYSLKWTSKPSYISQKIFDNNLVAIYKNKVRLNSANQDIPECVYFRFK